MAYSVKISVTGQYPVLIDGYRMESGDVETRTLTSSTMNVLQLLQAKGYVTLTEITTTDEPVQTVGGGRQDLIYSEVEPSDTYTIWADTSLSPTRAKLYDHSLKQWYPIGVVEAVNVAGDKVVITPVGSFSSTNLQSFVSEIDNQLREMYKMLDDVQYVADITERNGLNLEFDTLVFVADASMDSTVVSGGAVYLYKASTGIWTKTSETESMDVVLDWSKIQGKPASSPNEIDDAVNYKHTHNNLTLLNTYDQTNANIKDAVAKKHSHGNLDILDTYTKTMQELESMIANASGGITDAYTTEETDTLLLMKADVDHAHDEYASKQEVEDLFTLVDDGKADVATAVIGKGGTVVGTAPHSFQELVDGVNSIPEGSGGTGEGYQVGDTILYNQLDTYRDETQRVWEADFEVTNTVSPSASYQPKTMFKDSYGNYIIGMGNADLGYIDPNGQLVNGGKFNQNVLSGNSQHNAFDMDTEGNIYAGGSGGRVTKLDKDGNIIWTTQFTQFVSYGYITSVRVNPSTNEVFVADSYGWIGKSDNEGALIWSVKPSGNNYGIELASDGVNIITGIASGIVKVSTADGSIIANGPPNQVTSLFRNHDGELVGVETGKRNVFVFNEDMSIKRSAWSNFASGTVDYLGVLNLTGYRNHLVGFDSSTPSTMTFIDTVNMTSTVVAKEGVDGQEQFLTGRTNITFSDENHIFVGDASSPYLIRALHEVGRPIGYTIIS